MFMNFRFQIEDVFEVYKDPGGHYHHWTFLLGRLLDGSIQVGQVFSVPAKDGMTLPCRVFALEVNHKQTQLVVAEQDAQIVVGLWQPAPVKEDIALGLVEWFHTDQSVNRLDLLRRHPTLYLHKIPSTGDLCPECLWWIGVNPRGMQILEELCSHSDAQIADLAILAKRLINRISHLAQDHRKGKWNWRFWK